MPIRTHLVAGALIVAIAPMPSASTTLAPQAPRAPRAIASKRMPDGKQWTAANLDIKVDGSYCYDDVEANCTRYGRLYTWEAAQRVCPSLGDGWRLPTNDEWQGMAKHYGGVRDDSADGGKAAYAALIVGGSSGFDSVYGGNREPGGRAYARGDAHGFYWTSTETGPASAWLYNLGRNGQILNRHRDGENQQAVSVRCIRDGLRL